MKIKDKVREVLSEYSENVDYTFNMFDTIFTKNEMVRGKIYDEIVNSDIGKRMNFIVPRIFILGERGIQINGMNEEW